MIVKIHDFPASRFTTLRVQVAIHPTHRCLQAFYELNHDDGDDVRAYCACSQLNDSDKITAALNFSRDDLSVPLITHEATHAMETILLHMRLAPGTETYSEIQAETVENIVRETLLFCSKHKIKVASRSGWV